MLKIIEPITPLLKDERVSLDDFALAGESEVAGLVLALVQLGHARSEVGGGKAHPIVEPNHKKCRSSNVRKGIMYHIANIYLVAVRCSPQQLSRPNWCFEPESKDRFVTQLDTNPLTNHNSALLSNQG